MMTSQETTILPGVISIALLPSMLPQPPCRSLDDGNPNFSRKDFTKKNTFFMIFTWITTFHFAIFGQASDSYCNKDASERQRLEMPETTDPIFFKTILNQISNCRKLIAVDTTQVNDEGISQQDSLQSMKEVPHFDQAYFFTIPLKYETQNDSHAFEQLSVPIPNDVPASTMNSCLSQLRMVVPTSSFLLFHFSTNATGTVLHSRFTITSADPNLHGITTAHVFNTFATTTATMNHVPTIRSATTKCHNSSLVETKRLELNMRR